MLHKPHPNSFYAWGKEGQAANLYLTFALTNHHHKLVQQQLFNSQCGITKSLVL